MTVKQTLQLGDPILKKEAEEITKGLKKRDPKISLWDGDEKSLRLLKAFMILHHADVKFEDIPDGENISSYFHRARIAPRGARVSRGPEKRRSSVTVGGCRTDSADAGGREAGV